MAPLVSYRGSNNESSTRETTTSAQCTMASDDSSCFLDSASDFSGGSPSATTPRGGATAESAPSHGWNNNGSPASSNYHTTMTSTPTMTTDTVDKGNTDVPAKLMRRRAARACVSCRARKVRCDVVEGGAPCGNCRWDKVECIVPERYRGKDRSQQQLFLSPLNQPALLDGLGITHCLYSLNDPRFHIHLPSFIRPLPAKIAAEDVKYLHCKGALALPGLPLQSALIQAYVEYVHPYMPSMQLHDFVNAVNSTDGLCGQISLFLYHAVMFAASAFVDIEALSEAGYQDRKAARKAFFEKTRLLYEFDSETDRLILIQGLLLMTYWYEAPEDQKDPRYWMGAAISLAYTIGLHCDPAMMGMSPRNQKLWKRIWWSCYVRDRILALDMKRPTMIKDEDFDVPLLEEDDFELEILPQENTVISPRCTLMRDVGMQRELAIMSSAMAKLCVYISHVLRLQYSVLIREGLRQEDKGNSIMILLPRQNLRNDMEAVNTIHLTLLAWADSLPACCQYRPLTPWDAENGRATIAVHRTLLQLAYYNTLSALHRTSFLPSSPHGTPSASRPVQEISRLRVCNAAMNTTRIVSELHQLRLDKFLPTTGVTVIVPAMMVHLLEMKSRVPQAREDASKRFGQCMEVLQELSAVYSVATYAADFLDVSFGKAAVDMDAASWSAMPGQGVKSPHIQFGAKILHAEGAPSMAATSCLSAEAATHKGPLMRPFIVDSDMEIAMWPLLTERDLESAIGGLMPSASDTSKGAPHNMGHMQGYEQCDWNDTTDTGFHVDQLLHFPLEGASNHDDTFVGMVDAGNVAMTPEQAWAWAMAAETGQESNRVNANVQMAMV